MPRLTSSQFMHALPAATRAHLPPRLRKFKSAARGWLCHVNLIPLNPTPAAPWGGSPRAAIDAFAAILRRAGIGTTVRDTRGRSIEAACGQLHAQLAKRSLRSLPELDLVPT